MALSRRRWYRELRLIQNDPWRECIVREAQSILVRLKDLGVMARVALWFVEFFLVGLQFTGRIRHGFVSLGTYTETLEDDNARLRSRIAELENNAAQSKAMAERYRVLRRRRVLEEQ